MKTPREKVYSVIDSERDYQDKLSCDRTELCDIPVSIRRRETADYLIMLNTYIQKANNDWTQNAGSQEALKQIRKIAAIAVHCMEDNGAIPRE